MSSSKERRSLIGVNFRSWTQMQGQQLGLAGFVRNANDGSVEGQGVGEKQLLNQLCVPPA